MVAVVATRGLPVPALGSQGAVAVQAAVAMDVPDAAAQMRTVALPYKVLDRSRIWGTTEDLARESTAAAVGVVHLPTPSTATAEAVSKVLFQVNTPLTAVVAEAVLAYGAAALGVGVAIPLGLLATAQQVMGAVYTTPAFLLFPTSELVGEGRVVCGM